MSKRMDALWRVAAFIWSVPAGIVSSFAMIVGLLWGIVDVVWQLILGSDGLSASSMPAKWVKRLIMWPVNLTVYAITGSGDFQLWP